MDPVLTLSKPTYNEQVPTVVHVDRPTRGIGRTVDSQVFEGRIDRGAGSIWRACLGFMDPREASNLNIATAIANGSVAIEEDESYSNAGYKMSKIPAPGVGNNWLYGWRVSRDNDGSHSDGPYSLGLFDLILANQNEFTDNSAIVIKSRHIQPLGSIVEPPPGPDPWNRQVVLPSVVMPTAWMLDKAVFQGDNGTRRVFAVVVRPNSAVPQEPVGIPYVVEATKDPNSNNPNSNKWIASSIHTAVIEPSPPPTVENELIMWEYRGGSNWTFYRRQFYARKYSL